MRLMRTLFVILLILVISAGCDLPQKAVQVKAADNPHAWFDAPLNGNVLTLGEAYEVVFHIASLGGVSRGELSIEGAVFATLENPNGSVSPATLRQMWTPGEPGVYTLKVRGQSTSGQWSELRQGCHHRRRKYHHSYGNHHPNQYCNPHAGCFIYTHIDCFLNADFNSNSHPAACRKHIHSRSIHKPILLWKLPAQPGGCQCSINQHQSDQARRALCAFTG